MESGSRSFTSTSNLSIGREFAVKGLVEMQKDFLGSLGYGVFIIRDDFKRFIRTTVRVYLRERERERVG